MNNEFLIRRAKKDDKDAFCRLMDEHLQCMYKMASAYLKNDEDVADAIQGYTGAPVLCAGGAVHSGCGLVFLGAYMKYPVASRPY